MVRISLEVDWEEVDPRSPVYWRPPDPDPDAPPPGPLGPEWKEIGYTTDEPFGSTVFWRPPHGKTKCCICGGMYD